MAQPGGELQMHGSITIQVYRPARRPQYATG
jgi:hypothetical protein